VISRGEKIKVAEGGKNEGKGPEGSTTLSEEEIKGRWEEIGPEL